MVLLMYVCFFFQAEDGIRDAQESRGLGDVYKRQNRRFSLGWIIAIILTFIIINSINIPAGGIFKEMTYGEFYALLKEHPEKIKSAVKRESIIQGTLQDKSSFLVHIPDNDPELLNLMRNNLKDFDVKPARTFWTALLFNLGPVSYTHLTLPTIYSV